MVTRYNGEDTVSLFLWRMNELILDQMKCLLKRVCPWYFVAKLKERIAKDKFFNVSTTSYEACVAYFVRANGPVVTIVFN